MHSSKLSRYLTLPLVALATLSLKGDINPSGEAPKPVPPQPGVSQSFRSKLMYAWHLTLEAAPESVQSKCYLVGNLDAERADPKSPIAPYLKDFEKLPPSQRVQRITSIVDVYTKKFTTIEKALPPQHAEEFKKFLDGTRQQTQLYKIIRELAFDSSFLTDSPSTLANKLIPTLNDEIETTRLEKMAISQVEPSLRSAFEDRLQDPAENSEFRFLCTLKDWTDLPIRERNELIALYVNNDDVTCVTLYKIVTNAGIRKLQKEKKRALINFLLRGKIKGNELIIDMMNSPNAAESFVGAFQDVYDSGEIRLARDIAEMTRRFLGREPSQEEVDERIQFIADILKLKSDYASNIDVYTSTHLAAGWYINSSFGSSYSDYVLALAEALRSASSLKQAQETVFLEGLPERNKNGQSHLQIPSSPRLCRDFWTRPDGGRREVLIFVGKPHEDDAPDIFRNDASLLKDVLEERFGANVTSLEPKNSREMRDAIETLGKAGTRGVKDQALIIILGHGNASKSMRGARRGMGNLDGSIRMNDSCTAREGAIKTLLNTSVAPYYHGVSLITASCFSGSWKK